MDRNPLFTRLNVFIKQKHCWNAFERVCATWKGFPLPLMPCEQEGSSWGDTSVSLALVNSCQEGRLPASPPTLRYVHPAGVRSVTSNASPDSSRAVRS